MIKSFLVKFNRKSLLFKLSILILIQSLLIIFFSTLGFIANSYIINTTELTYPNLTSFKFHSFLAKFVFYFWSPVNILLWIIGLFFSLRVYFLSDKKNNYIERIFLMYFCVASLELFSRLLTFFLTKS